MISLALTGWSRIRARASVYDCDGYTLEKAVPEIVVLPHSTEEVAAVVKFLNKEKIAFVPRGAGTGLSGGCLPVEAPVMIGTSRLNQIVHIDLLNRYVVASVRCGESVGQ